MYCIILYVEKIFHKKIKETWKLSQNSYTLDIEEFKCYAWAKMLHRNGISTYLLMKLILVTKLHKMLYDLIINYKKHFT